MSFHIGECMYFLLDYKSWAKGAFLLALLFQSIYSGEPHPEKIFAEEEISENWDGNWREFIKSRISSQGREGEIKEQLIILTHPYEQIPLMEELIKLKLNSFKEQGGSLESFLPEAIDRAKNFKGLFPFEGALGESKLDLFMLHSTLAVLTGKANSEISYFSPHVFPLPHLRFFDFEQETGLILWGMIPLIKELINCRQLIFCLKLRGAYLKEEEWWKSFWESPEMAAEYYWGPQFAFLKRLLECIEKGQYLEIKKRVLKSVMDGYFNPDLNKWLPPKDEACDPLVHLLPHIIRFVPIEDFKKYFQERFNSLDPWEIEALWIDLHFRKIEALEASDYSQALEQIEQTEKEIDANLWAYPFSWNYTKWHAKRTEAQERLAKWKAKLLLGVEEAE